MADRVLGPSGGMRRRRSLGLLSLAGLLALALTLWFAIGAGAVGDKSHFEDDDGNLEPGDAIVGPPAAPTPNFDWNSFDPDWTGAAPNRVGTDESGGWDFDGIEDAQATTSDNGFAGGTKQDEECASVITAKAPNKDDLKRVYFANSTVDVSGEDHVFLNLAWVRIPQNTTSPSAHVAFEFNQSETECGGPGDLVERSTENGGDVLIVYDFQGGATDTPTIRLSRWVGSGPCEVASHAPPCWGPADILNADEAEARVNTSTVGTVSDEILPAPPAAQTLGLNEFGEAGIDLTEAGVFPEGECRSFGNAFAVSRTSGSSSTAQMKDLVGPGNVDISNCGRIKIIKHTNPRGLDQDFGFTSDIAGGELTCTQDTTPASFTLNDNGNTTGDSAENTEDCTNVPAGDYFVLEGADPAGFAFDDVTCTATDGSSGTQNATTPKQVDISLAADGLVTCTYVNNQQLGAIKVTKTRKHAAAEGTGPVPHPGVNFTVNGVTKATDDNGEACFDGLPFDSDGTAYDVTETLPAGYQADGDLTKSVTVNNSASCSETPYTGETVSFSNTPLTDITVSVDSQVDGGTASTIDCVPPAGDPPPTETDPDGDGSLELTDKVPGTYTCTIVVDP